MQAHVIREGSVAALLVTSPQRGGQWEADVVASPVAEKFGAWTCFPPMVVVVEAKSGFVFYSKVFDPGQPDAQLLGDGLIEAMTRHGQIPAAVSVRPGFDEALTALAVAVGARIQVRGAMEALASYLRAAAAETAKKPA